MTVNDLINTLLDGVRKGTISACSPVVMADELPVFVVMDSQQDVVYVTDVNPNETDEVPEPENGSGGWIVGRAKR